MNGCYFIIGNRQDLQDKLYIFIPVFQNPVHPVDPVRKNYFEISL